MIVNRYEKRSFQIMWSGFEKFNAKLDNSSQNETIDHISTIAGSLASIETEHTESPVSRNRFVVIIPISRQHAATILYLMHFHKS